MTIVTDPTRVPADTLVVGWDGSRHSTSALKWAIDNASGERRPITVVHAVSPPFALRADAEQLRYVGDGLMSELQTILDQRGGPLDVRVLVTPGEAHVLLVDLSRRAAMVVIGSHGRGPIGSKLLGSVGVDVVRHARCPVVVIRPDRPGTVRRGVLAALDVDERAAGVAAFAFHQASVLELPLTIVHTVPTGSSYVIVDNAERHLSELIAGFRELHPDVHCTTAVVPGDPEDVILEHARGRHLAVIGASRKVGHVLTTTASRLIEHSTVPIAVVPPDVVPLEPAADDATSPRGRRSARVGDA